MSPIFKVATALSFCLLCAQVFAQSQQADAALCGRGQGVEAFRACLRLANHGHRGAQFNVGLMYSNGEGTARDDAQALYWFRKSAEQGFPQAQDMLCGTDNGELGLQSCTRQAQAGNRYAQFNLAVMYRNGNGVSKDPAQAAHWYRKAADQGFDLAQLALGEMYDAGEGVSQDKQMAVSWFRKAADQGNAAALNHLANNEDAGAIKAAADRRIPVDLSNPKEAFLDAVVLVGRSKDFAKVGWGSGFLISKCHVMTAHHVVFDHKQDEEMKLGKEVVVGFGQKNSSPWKSEMVVGKVVGFDSSIREINEFKKIEFSSGKDWALIKLSKLAGGRYPGEKWKPLCLQVKPLIFRNVEHLEFRSVGHPADKFMSTGKIYLWQDPKCRMIGILGRTWHADCQMRRGMSGGPIVTFLENANPEDNCWMPIGVISDGKIETGGFTRSGEHDVNYSNELTPLDNKNVKLINAAMEQAPCD